MKIRIALLIAATVGILSAEDPSDKAEKADDKPIERCQESASLLDQIMAMPDHAIPHKLLAKARCIALIPGMKKAGFIFAGKYGKGVLACRAADGETWHGPSSLRLEGGSFGLQVGGSSTDVILLVMNEEGVDKLLSSKFTLGADASVAGGPVGRTAQVQTDAQMHAKILAYSRSRGLFAGLSIEGATLRPDVEANRRLYGSDVKAEKILAGETTPPESTRGLLYALAKYATPTPADLAEKTPASKPPAPVEKPRPTLLTVVSDPDYAEVELNRTFNGLTPRTKQITAGQYEITVSKKGFQPWTRTVTVAAGESVTVNAKLNKLEVAAAEDNQVPITRPKRTSGIRVSGLPH